MMGLLGKKVAEARVALYNLKRFDLASGDPVLAAVDAPDSHALVDGRPVLTLILPLTAVTLLRNSRSQPELASPMMQLIGLAADQLVAGEEEARALRLKEQVGVDPMQVTDSDAEYAAAGIIGIGLPELCNGGGGPADKTLRAQLRVGRAGQPFGAVRGVGNGYQAALGWFPLLEHCARYASYQPVVKPVGEALAALADIYFDELDELPPSFDETSVLNATVLDVLEGQG